MIDIQKYREQGYLYDSLENYTSLINFEEFKEIKNFIDKKNIKRHSKYDYWFKYKDFSYMEEITYDALLKNDNNLEVADEVYEKNHQYQLKKIEESGFYPTWVFGTSMNSDIQNVLHNGVIRDFQKKFVNEYYTDKLFKNYSADVRLQFYDKGCEIKLHDDGIPENRICVFLYFLNTEWNDQDGGNLILYTKNNESIKLKPVFPNFVVLDSDINLFHELEKIKNNLKYNIVSFYSGNV